MAKPGDTPLKARNPQVEAIDLYIGAKIRAARAFRGLTREQLAAELGLMRQAVDKYERGENRLMASRLHQIARILDMPVEFFFEGFTTQGSTPANALSQEDLKAMTVTNMQTVRDIAALSPEQRRVIRQQIDAMLSANRMTSQAAGSMGMVPA